MIKKKRPYYPPDDEIGGPLIFAAGLVLFLLLIGAFGALLAL